MKKYKIAFLISQLSGGGAERVISNLANMFAKQGHDIIVITVSKSDNEYYISKDIKRFVLNDPTINYKCFPKPFVRTSRLRKICKTEKPDVLIAFMGNVLYYSIFATLGLHTKSIVSIRNDPNFLYKGKLKKILAKLLLPIADGCVFQTEDAKKWFPRRMQKKSRIIFNPISDDFYETPYSPMEWKVMTCGRLVKQKNHEMLINAFSYVVKHQPKAKLYIFGDGPLKEQLMEQICFLGLQNNVFLLGRVNNVYERISSATVFVLSSDVEGAPNALMEAMAIGIPCISTDCPCGGPKMLLGDNENGILIPVGNIDAMFENIMFLLNNEQARVVYSRNAKLKALNFKGAQIYEEWLKYVESIC